MKTSTTTNASPGERRIRALKYYLSFGTLRNNNLMKAQDLEEGVSLRRAANGVSCYPLSTERAPGLEREVLDEAAFWRMLSLERKRSERSRSPFLLMLLETANNASEKNGEVLLNTAFALPASTRETDATGWYKHGLSIGTIFTDFVNRDKRSILSAMSSRVNGLLKSALTLEQFNQLSISFHFFPDDWDDHLTQRPRNPVLYPDLMKRHESQHSFRVMKRAMDVIGSIAALTILSPLFVLVAVAIKTTSQGPVLFRQHRVGQDGTPFVFLKFRSMQADNDASIHQQYVQQLIAGTADKQPSNGNGRPTYKLTNDPRITFIGALLRRTSIDELPQFINVLRGEMSLVGPRPPLQYEVKAYDIWHRRRLLEAKPGITGLWQVNGRSRVTFNEMVRLDLEYARTWTPWMDLKILLRTPGAVLLGEGAH